MKYLLSVLALIAAPAPVPVQAAPADPGGLDFAVAQFTGVPLGQPGGAAQPVDRRLRLAACANPLSLSWYAGRRDTVLVQCPDIGGWRVFVPLLQVAAKGDAVLRGEAVTIAVGGPGFSVSQPGEAMENGAVGTWIRVKTTTAGAQPLRARIVRPGLVRVDLGAGDPGADLGSDLP